MSQTNPRRTALYDSHILNGGKIIEFAGWELPVYYEGIIEEHDAVRNKAGLFDVSHMGEFIVKGLDAQNFVNYIVTNDVASLSNNQIAYSPMCYENGGIVDDILVYKHNENFFMLVVNASNIEKDFEWVTKNKGNFDVDILNVSSQLSQIAIQGPNAESILQSITSFNLSNLKFFFFQDDVIITNTKCLVSRSGYTGEDGFEIYVENEKIREIFDKLLEIGKNEGLKPAGLGCRDTLRFEATLPLYGNEISQDISPLEAALGIFVKMSKSEFIGKTALSAQKDQGLNRKLVGFEMIDRAIPRHGYDVFANEEKIGVVTTGYMSLSLKKNIGLAMVDSNYSNLGTDFEIVVRNKRYKATVISKNFYNKNYKK